MSYELILSKINGKRGKIFWIKYVYNWPKWHIQGRAKLVFIAGLEVPSYYLEMRIRGYYVSLLPASGIR